jgi:DNA modification methylase
MLSKIVPGDNLATMQQFAASGAKFDLICTDPPYNVGKDFGNDTDRQEVDQYLEDIGKRIAILRDITTDSAGLVWFASHLYVHHMRLLLEKHGWYYQRMMIWHYKNGMSRQVNTPVTEYEPFLWFTRSKTDFVYNVDEVRVPYRSERVKNPVYKTNKRGDKVAWNPDPRGAKRGDVWQYPTLAGKVYADERTDHPSQKPESLVMDLLRAFVPRNEQGFYEGNVLDPYAGSGTTLVCCARLNLYGHHIGAVGCELEDRWVDVAKQRLTQVGETHIL